MDNSRSVWLGLGGRRRAPVRNRRSGASAAMCRITSSAASQLSYLYSDSPLI